jgi:RNase H-fold protein (predicted Holliday junction resolvase)
MILAIDPGRGKCGLAVLDNSIQALEKKVVSRSELIPEVLNLVAKYRVETIVIGGGTASKSVQKELSRIDMRVNIIFVPERFSTLQARRLYWKENPPRGLLRFIPTSLRTPPHPIDDYAAQILGMRYLKG